MTDRESQRAADAALAEHEARLESALAALTTRPESAGSIPFGKRVGEGTAAAAERMAAVSTQEQLLRSLEDVRRARRRIAEGTYGTCEVCGTEIPAGRLEARPQTSRCVEHA